MVSRHRIATDSLAVVIVLVLCASSSAAQSATTPGATRLFVAAGPLFTTIQLDAGTCVEPSSCERPSNSPTGLALSAGFDFNERFALAAEATVNGPRMRTQHFRNGVLDYHADTRQRDLAITMVGRLSIGATPPSLVIVGGAGIMDRRTDRGGVETRPGSGLPPIPRDEWVRETVPVAVVGADVPLFRTGFLTLALPLRVYFAGAHPPQDLTVPNPPHTSDLGECILRFGLTFDFTLWQR